MAGTERVIVLRALGLGDMFAAVPALRGVRRRWDAAEIVLAASPSLGGLMVDHGLVDRVVPASGPTTPPWDGPPPDVAVNLHGRGPQSHRALQQLRPRELVAFRCDTVGLADAPAWVPDEHEVDRWCRLVRSAGGNCSAADLRLTGPHPHPGSPLTALLARRPQPPIVVHPGAAAGSRRWPGHRWAAVAGELAADGWPVVVTGGPDERAICRAVASAHAAITDLSGTLDLRDLAALIGRAGLLLSGDTGVAHLATAYGTRSVLLFGPTPPHQWGPRSDPELHQVLWRPGADDPPGDPHGETTDVRLERITAYEVVTAARNLLEARQVLARPRQNSPQPSADQALGR
jgi:ADP-heptose:LPS heptosyltransferase